MPYLPRENVRQVLTTRVLVDTTTISTSLVDLLSISITTSSDNFLLIFFTASCSSSSSNDWGQFRLNVDGTLYTGTVAMVATANTSASCGIVYRLAVAAGAHTVKIQWLAGGGGTVRIRPVSTFTDHGFLIVKEVSV